MKCVVNIIGMTKEELHSIVESRCPNIVQMAAYRNGEKILSDTWNGHCESDCQHIMSATKSVVGVLFGIALDMGLMESVDTKVLAFFPEYQVKRGEKTIGDVTLRHLLTMRAPYKCKGDPWTKVCSSENWTYASLDFLGGRKGLTDTFNYQTVCLHILSGILARVSGMSNIEFANRYLFSPLGIEDRSVFFAKDAQEHKAFTITKLPRGKVWFADPQNLGTPGYGLCLSAEEMAKIGLMCLNGGVFEGKRIVSESWIREMTRPRVVEDGNFSGMQYGYLWWIIDPEKNIYAAIGNSGNVIYVNPEENLTVAVASYFKPTVFDRVDFIREVVEPYCLQ